MRQETNPVMISAVGIPANDLNDPLQAILSNTEAVLLLLSSSNPDIDKIKAVLGDVLAEVGRVKQMIRGGIDSG